MKSPDPQTASPEELLSHAKWVRSLAQSLLADPHLADDVAQDAVLVALEKRPYGGSGLKAWFAQVARGLAHNKRRGDQRRRLREWKASGSASTPPTSTEIVEWAEHMRDLAYAISRLEASDRDLIAKIYFEEMRPAQIAREQGVPAATVRSRHQRALQKLRADLKSRFGPDDWLTRIGVLAVPFATPSVAGWSGVISISTWISKLTLMNAKFKFAAAAIAASLLGWAAWPSDEEPLTTQTAELELAEVISGEVPSDVVESVEVLAATSKNRKPDLSAAASEKGAVEVRVIDQAGNPVEGVSVSAMIVHIDWYIKGMPIKRWAWTATPDSRERIYGKTNGDGLVRLHGLERSSAVLIHGRKKGYALAGLIEKRQADSDVQKLPDLTLPPGGAASFEVVDEDGEAVAGATIEIQSSPMSPVGILTWQYGETDSNGLLSFSFLINQNHHAEVFATGFVRSKVDLIQPGIDEPAIHTVTLKRGLSIAGKVLDSKGRPVPNVPIFLLPKGEFGHGSPDWFTPREQPWTQTDSQGNFIAEGLTKESGNYRLIAMRSSTVRGFTDLIEAGAQVEITIPIAHKVSGQITNPNGTPTERGGYGFVNVKRPNEQGEVFHSAERDGSFEVLLAEGTYGGMVKSIDGDKIVDPFEVTDDVDLGTLQLKAGIPLTVTTLSSKDHSPIPFPNHVRDTGNPSFLDETVFDPSAWKRRILYTADRRSFSFPKHLKDHVIQYNHYHPGKFELITIETGYIQKSTPVELKEGEPQELTIYLDPAAMVELTVTTPEGTPVADQEFQLNPILEDGSYDRSRFTYRATTDSAGVARFTQIAPGLVRMGYHTRFIVKDGQNQFSYQLPSQGALKVKVLDPNGASPGARTFLSRVLADDPYPGAMRGETDLNGEFEYLELNPGTYRLRVEKDGSPSLTKQMDLTGTDQIVEMKLSGVTVSGKIPTEHLELVDKLFVTLHGYPMTPQEMATANPDTLGQTHWQQSASAQIRCNSDGTFEFTNVPTGLFFVSIWTRGYRALGATQLNVLSNDFQDVKVPVLVPESKVVVNIVGLDAFIAKQPRDYFYARLYDEMDREVGKVAFEGNGEKEIRGLAPGACTLKISSLQRPSMEEMHHATIPILVGEPGTTVTVHWPSDSDG